MKTKLKSIVNSFDALSIREKALITFTPIIIMFFIWDSFVLPAIEKKSTENLAHIEELQQKEKVIQITNENEKVFLSLEQNVSQLTQELSELKFQTAMHSPSSANVESMTYLLNQIIKNDEDLNIISVKNLPTEEISNWTLQGKFKHGLEIVLEGDFINAVRYINSIDNIKKEIAWREIKISEKEWPTLSISLTIDIPSKSESWIGSAI